MGGIAAVSMLATYKRDSKSRTHDIVCKFGDAVLGCCCFYHGPGWRRLAATRPFSVATATPPFPERHVASSHDRMRCESGAVFLFKLR